MSAWALTSATPGKRARRHDHRSPQRVDGRAPDVFTPGGWVPMRSVGDDEAVDFAIVGRRGGRGDARREAGRGGVLGRPVRRRPVLAAAGRLRLGRTGAADSCTGPTTRITGGADPIALGGNNSGRGVGGSTVHFSMISLRFRPDWFAAAAGLATASTGPSPTRRSRRTTTRPRRPSRCPGPVRYPWGPPRRRYPYREHEVNAAGLVLARGAEALGIPWAATPLATVSAPRGKSPPCVYRGFCNFGCSTNAKQSALVVWVPRALRAGVEVRDLAMVGRIEVDDAGRANGRALSPRGRVAVPACRQRRRFRLCDRDAAPAAQLRMRAFPRWPRQRLRPRRYPPDDPFRPGRLGDIRGGDPLVQGAAQHGGDASTGTTRTRARTSSAATPS